MNHPIFLLRLRPEKTVSSPRRECQPTGIRRQIKPQRFKIMTNVQTSERLIRGSILRCVDGKWADALGIAPPERLVALGTTQALQCWSGGKPTDTVMARPGEPLPN